MAPTVVMVLLAAMPLRVVAVMAMVVVAATGVARVAMAVLGGVVEMEAREWCIIMEEEEEEAVTVEVHLMEVAVVPVVVPVTIMIGGPVVTITIMAMEPAVAEMPVPTVVRVLPIQPPLHSALTFYPMEQQQPVVVVLEAVAGAHQAVVRLMEAEGEPIRQL